VFLRLGCTAFGGPMAHLGYFRRELVERRGWVDARTYADLLALCQFLPGPASSQLAMALGLQRAGAGGLVLAWLGFTLPSAVILAAAGLGVSGFAGLGAVYWLSGLKLAAVAVVGHAVLRMAREFCRDRIRAFIAVAAAAGSLLVPGGATQLLALGVSALVGAMALGAGPSLAAPPVQATDAYPAVVGRVALLVFALLLLVLPALGARGPGGTVALLADMYRAGALVFGGGHVVLPMLQPAVVPAYLSNDVFLTGYGLAQAVPGPLFAFAAYVGAAASLPVPPLLAALGCLILIYLPSFLLLLGTLPHWERLRRPPRARAALSGVNAAVVGILGAAFYDPVVTSSITGWTDAGIALLGFLLLAALNVSSLWVLLVCAALAAAVHVLA
jgi:chromate transporter